VKNALGNGTTYTYDNMGYPTEVVDALGNYTTTVYNGSKQVTANIDALGSYTYDSSGRKVYYTY
jgi:YD repeat-containing protein